MISMDGSDHLHNVGSITINEPSPIWWGLVYVLTCDAKIDLQYFDIAVPQGIMVKWLARHNLRYAPCAEGSR
ncbi:hypothetical protein N7465_005995 [Penicillium sp. CMV-2018d]|nr:hypothetical protein N7465_005995 [Penicillium sp. CMV-2018d]